MKNVKMLTILMASTLAVPFFASADSVSSQWGNWGAAEGEQDKFFTAQAISDTEILEAETANIDISTGSAFGTQLEGNPDAGMDTDGAPGLDDLLAVDQDSVDAAVTQLVGTPFVGLDTDAAPDLDDLLGVEGDSTGAAGTQLAGTPFVGLDTDGAESLDDILAKE